MNVKEWLGENNQLGIDIYEKKYQYENETFNEWLDRVSGGNKDVKREIIAKRFLFGGRILANRGLSKHGIKITYSNCYVVPPPEDSIESIYDTASKLARTFSYGGGVGIDISKLAPRGAKVHNAAKKTSGAVSFMDLFSMTTDLIGMAGRRGALMLSISCDHPDLEEFISVKSDLDKVTKANISIRITDEFMKAVADDSDYDLEFVREETGEEIRKTVKAKEVFHKIAEMNWDMAEPGMLFWDTIQNWNLLSNYPDFEYAGVNPCAEQPLPAGGSCLLGSINLSEFIVNPYTENAVFDFDQFAKTVGIAVKALNEVLDEGLPLHPLEIQRQTVRDWRQIGLGVFGIADMLIKCGIKYGSPESLKLCREIAELMAKKAILTSNELAITDGAFPKCDPKKIVKTPFFQQFADGITEPLIEDFGLRNSQLLTIAPTGSLSSMLQVSGGIEPYFARSWQRKTESLHGEDVYYTERPKAIQELMDLKGLKSDEELPDYIVTSEEIHPKHRIDMQSTWQRFIDASISSTLNLPNSATVEEVEDIYRYAWLEGLKGITIYRDGCRRSGILTTTKDDEEQSYTQQLERGDIICADDDVVGKKRKLTTGCGSLHCIACFDPVNGDLLETYLSKGSTGGCNNFMIGLSRMISTSARAGVSIDVIVDQLLSCGVCPSYAVRTATKQDTSKGACCPTAVAYALKDMWNEMQYELGIDCGEDTLLANVRPQSFERKNPEPTDTQCPECGEKLTFEGGCNICKSCGWSKCE